jgi:hypothetical protein
MRGRIEGFKDSGIGGLGDLRIPEFLNPSIPQLTE